MKIVGILPAKGNSSRVQNKNRLLLFNRPLFIVNLDKLTKCESINEVYLDTESEEMIDLAQGLNIKIFRRDESLATNKTDGNKLLLNAASHIDADIYVILLATSPFIYISSIEKGINILKENEHYDSVVGVRNEKLYLWKNNVPTYDINNIPNSFELEDTIIETMGLYIIRKEALFRTRRRIGDNPYLLELSPTESLDINYPQDYQLAQYVAKGMEYYEL